MFGLLLVTTKACLIHLPHDNPPPYPAKRPQQLVKLIRRQTCCEEMRTAAAMGHYHQLPETVFQLKNPPLRAGNPLNTSSETELASKPIRNRLCYSKHPEIDSAEGCFHQFEYSSVFCRR